MCCFSVCSSRLSKQSHTFPPSVPTAGCWFTCIFKKKYHTPVSLLGPAANQLSGFPPTPKAQTHQLNAQAFPCASFSGTFPLNPMCMFCFQDWKDLVPAAFFKFLSFLLCFWILSISQVHVSPTYFTLAADFSSSPSPFLHPWWWGSSLAMWSDQAGTGNPSGGGNLGTEPWFAQCFIATHVCDAMRALASQPALAWCLSYSDVLWTWLKIKISVLIYKYIST